MVHQLVKTFICSGGGVALLYASKELDKLHTANFDQKIGVQIIQNALKVRTFVLLVKFSSLMRIDIFSDFKM
jgi:chaperonin GroEL (HSP60 family)